MTGAIVSTRILPFFCMVLIGNMFLATLCAQEPATEVEVKQGSPIAHAYELAGAFSNDGFLLRDGHWKGKATEKGKTLAVTLYAGNSYWFCVAAKPGQEVREMIVLDENGMPMEGENFTDGHRAAFGMDAPHSGRYFVQLKGRPAENDPEVCFLYLYK